MTRIVGYNNRNPGFLLTCSLISLVTDNHVNKNLKEILVYVYFGSIVNNCPKNAVCTTYLAMGKLQLFSETFENNCELHNFAGKKMDPNMKAEHTFLKTMHSPTALDEYQLNLLDTIPMY